MHAAYTCRARRYSAVFARLRRRQPWALPPFGLPPPLAASSAMRLFLPFGSASTSLAGARIFTAAAGLLDRRDGRFRGAVDREFDLGLELAVAEQLHAVLGAPHQAGLDHGRGVDRAVGIEHAGVDRRLHLAEIDFVELDRERRVAEAALGQAPVQRHLAAFEALDAHAGARGLALAAAAAGLAHAGADAAADAHAVLARARAVGDLVEFHRRSPLTSPRRPRAPDAATCGSCRASTACPAGRGCGRSC